MTVNVTALVNLANRKYKDLFLLIYKNASIDNPKVGYIGVIGTSVT